MREHKHLIYRIIPTLLFLQLLLVNIYAQHDVAKGSSIDNLQREFETNLELQNWEKAATALLNKAELQVMDRQFDASIATYEQAEFFSKKHHLPFKLWDALSAVGEMSVMRGDLQKAKRIFKEMETIPIHKENPSQLARVQTKLGHIYMQLGKLDTAKLLLEKSLATFLETKDSAALFLPINFLGAYYGRIGHYDKEIEYQLRAIEIKKIQKDSITLPGLYHSISEIFTKKGELKKAEKYANEGLSLIGNRHLPMTTSSLYQNLAEISIVKGDTKIAANHLESAIISLKETNNIHIIKCYLDLAKIRQSEGLESKAFELLKSANDRAVESNDQFRIASTEIALGNFFLKKDETQKSIINFKQGIKRAESVNGKVLTLEGQLLLSKAYEKTGSYKLAFEAHQNHLNLKDSIFSKDKEKLIREMDTRYQVNEKEHEITELNIANQLKDLKLEDARRKQFLFLGILLGLGLLILGGIYLFNLKQKANKLLAEKNKIVNSALEEKEVLIREIHHRVKNNLQVISSLLKLQSIHLSDENALAAIEEGRNRVQSMALIHQNLYRDNNVTSINATDYIETLSNTLFTSYNIEAEKVDLRTNIEPLNLDVDTAIPLGLILNELISNALKHAFKNKGSGLIKIELNEKNETLHLIVSDNGSGFDQQHVESRKGKSFGMELVEMLSEKLEATVNIEQSKGTSIELKIKNYNLA